VAPGYMQMLRGDWSFFVLHGRLEGRTGRLKRQPRPEVSPQLTSSPNFPAVVSPQNFNPACCHGTMANPGKADNCVAGRGDVRRPKPQEQTDLWAYRINWRPAREGCRDRTR
jgi:hypothetical protein